MNIQKLLSFSILIIYASIAFSQVPGSQYRPSLYPDGTEMKDVLTDIGEILKTIYVVDYNGKDDGFKKPQDVQVFDDRIEFLIRKIPVKFVFSELLQDNEIFVEEKTSKLVSGHTLRGFWSFLTIGNFLFYYSKNEPLRKLADDFYFIQNGYVEITKDSLHNKFLAQAAEYRALMIKPEITEEQRKFVVQANHFTELKEYEKAIERYSKVIEVNPVSYPAAYFNMALLSAQIKQFNAAILYMQKYLILVPDAEDARAAQDKIYEWEIDN